MHSYEDLTFPAGATLLDTSQPLQHALFILEGEVRLELKLGDRTVFLPIGPGEFIGDIAAVVTQNPDQDGPTYQGQAIAMTPVRATLIPLDDIREEIRQCPPMIRAWLGSFVGRVLRVVEELTS
jgi:CRP-like cAMP-binding protein